MVSVMNLKTATKQYSIPLCKRISGRKGSYIVEAALSLPVLIICVCAIILIIRIYAICEELCFTSADKMKELCIESFMSIKTVSLCSELKTAFSDSCDIKINSYRVLHAENGTDNLISIDITANFKVISNNGINGIIDFNERLRARVFNGSTNEFNPLDEAEFCNGEGSRIVYIFPKYGERYHIKGCRYIKQNIKEGYRIAQMESQDAYRKGFTPCTICIGAANG